MNRRKLPNEYFKQTINYVPYEFKKELIFNTVGEMVYFHNQWLVYHLNTTFHDEFKVKFKMYHFDALYKQIYDRFGVWEDFKNYPNANDFMRTIEILFLDPEIGMKNERVLNLKSKYQNTVIGDFIEWIFEINNAILECEDINYIRTIRREVIVKTMPHSFRISTLPPRKYVVGNLNPNE